jgi:hypothetical protein
MLSLYARSHGHCVSLGNMAKVRHTLPDAVAVFPKLDKIDIYQPKNAKGQVTGPEKRTWNTRLKFNDADHRTVDAWLKKLAKDAGLQSVANWPWKKDKKTGDVTLMVSSGEEYKPGLYDSRNNKLPEGVVIGGGSVLKANVSPFVYEGLGGGIKLYLNAVMVKKLEQGANGASPFDAEDDGYVAPEVTEEKSPFDPSTAATDDEEAF